MNSYIQAGRFALDTSRPLVMGVLNVTPDSFSDGGRYTSVDAALMQAERMLQDGADIIDIGAESTRPGASLVTLETELQRLLPVVEAINKRFDCCISIDTNKPAVMREVLDRNVSMINDVKGFREQGAFDVVSSSNAALCIMHMQGLPETMQDCPRYDDLLAEVLTFLRSQVDAAVASGIASNRIVIDPGFGFGKTVEQNLLLLKHVDELATYYPVLFGLSRKSTLGAVLKNPDAERKDISVAGALLAVANGASIVRVHDVKETCDALSLWSALERL